MSSDTNFAPFQAFHPGIDSVGPVWLVVLLALLADVLSTWYGLSLGLTEANPLAETVLDRLGFAGMWALKGAAVAAGVYMQGLLPARYEVLVPGVLAVTWSGAAAMNVGLILAVT